MEVVVLASGDSKPSIISRTVILDRALRRLLGELTCIQHEATAAPTQFQDGKKVALKAYPLSQRSSSTETKIISESKLEGRDVSYESSWSKSFQLYRFPNVSVRIMFPKDRFMGVACCRTSTRPDCSSFSWSAAALKALAIFLHIWWCKIMIGNGSVKIEMIKKLSYFGVLSKLPSEQIQPNCFVSLFAIWRKIGKTEIVSSSFLLNSSRWISQLFRSFSVRWVQDTKAKFYSLFGIPSIWFELHLVGRVWIRNEARLDDISKELVIAREQRWTANEILTLSSFQRWITQDA